jgi:hypothetical protein
MTVFPTAPTKMYECVLAAAGKLQVAAADDQHRSSRRAWGLR